MWPEQAPWTSPPSTEWGAQTWPPTPPNARPAPAEPWPASTLRFVHGLWSAVPCHPLPPGAIRTLRATFLACWLHEETFHGMARARFLEAAGHPVGPRERPRGQEPVIKRLEAMATGWLSRSWRDFCAVHMTWGAINELTTLTGYRRLAAVARHPVLDKLLERIVLDEARHFFRSSWRAGDADC